MANEERAGSLTQQPSQAASRLPAPNYRPSYPSHLALLLPAELREFLTPARPYQLAPNHPKSYPTRGPNYPKLGSSQPSLARPEHDLAAAA